MRNLNAMELVMVGGAGDPPKPPPTDNDPPESEIGKTIRDAWHYGSEAGSWIYQHTIGGGGSGDNSGKSGSGNDGNCPAPPSST